MMDKNNEADELARNQSKLLLRLFAFVIIFWAVSGAVTYYAASSWSDRGTIGDMFGAVNALFSGLAFAGLLYTIILQREEIRMNRLEIELNRKELKKSAAAQQNSQKALKAQVQQTHLTAEINAISTVINYYNTQIQNANSPVELIERARTKRRSLINRLDELIDSLQDSEID